MGVKGLVIGITSGIVGGIVMIAPAIFNGTEIDPNIFLGGWASGIVGWLVGSSLEEVGKV